MSGKTELDPKALIFEAYRIEGISEAQCRSIFLDWALGLPIGQDVSTAIQSLIDRYEPTAPDHPMNQVLRAGLQRMAPPKRRGGWRSRARPQ